MTARWSHRALALACVAGALGALAATGPAAASPADAPARVLVTAREYGLTLSRPRVEAGPAIVQLYDYGEDPHDLKLQRKGSNRVFSLGRGRTRRDGAPRPEAPAQLSLPALVLTRGPRGARHDGHAEDVAEVAQSAGDGRRSDSSSATVLTGALQVKRSQTYAAAPPSSAGRPASSSGLESPSMPAATTVLGR